jgi:hypothetical protein
MKKIWGRDRAVPTHKEPTPISEHRRVQIINGCRLLQLKGFDLYRNLATGAVAAYSSGFIFEFERISQRKAGELFAWFQLHENTQSGLATLPKGIKAYSVRKPTASNTHGHIKPKRGTVRVTSSITMTVTPTCRPSIAIGGSQSTVPGHYAELDWYDLLKR